MHTVKYKFIKGVNQGCSELVNTVVTELLAILYYSIGLKGIAP